MSWGPSIAGPSAAAAAEATAVVVAPERWSKLQASDVNPRDVDVLLSAELKQLTLEDREDIQEEIHGIRSLARRESHEMMRDALRRLEVEIGRIPHKPAYDRALELGSLYVHDRSFRIKFLRADLYDVRKAAIRFMGHLEMLLEYYGEQALMRPVMYSDLGVEEVHVLKKGNIQVLPSRDRFGRRVLCVVGGFGEGNSRPARVSPWKHCVPLGNRLVCSTGCCCVEHKCEQTSHKEPTMSIRRVQLRVLMYMVGTVMSEDDETQQNGMTHVYWPTDDLQEAMGEAKERREIARCAAFNPVRTSAVHFCLTRTEPVYHMLKAAIMMALPRDIRARSRVHMGKSVFGWFVKSDVLADLPFGCRVTP
jgi:hypothetical protein